MRGVKTVFFVASAFFWEPLGEAIPERKGASLGSQLSKAEGKPSSNPTASKAAQKQEKVT